MRTRANRTKPISDKLRAEDEELREKLRHFDVGQFDELLQKAVKPAKPAKTKSG
jgi:hypothetical protein